MGYDEEEDVGVEVLVEEPLDDAAGVAGAGDVAAGAAAGAEDSFFSSVFGLPVSLPVPDGGLSLSE